EVGKIFSVEGATQSGGDGSLRDDATPVGIVAVDCRRVDYDGANVANDDPGLGALELEGRRAALLLFLASGLQQPFVDGTNPGAVRLASLVIDDAEAMTVRRNQ